MEHVRFKNSFAESEERLLTCSKCKQELSVGHFSKSGVKTEARRGWNTYCRSCMSAYHKNIPKEKRIQASKKSYQKNKNKPENRIKSLLTASTVDRSALDFEWVWNRLEANNFRCEITNKEFSWESRSPTALSIDRIDPTKGYTKDNVRFICWWLNAAMSTWGLEKLEELISEWKNGA